MKKLKILQISGGNVKIPSKKGGGTEAVIYNLSKCLVKEGHSVTIIDRIYSEKDSDYESIDEIDIIRINSNQINYEKAHGLSYMIKIMVNI